MIEVKQEVKFCQLCIEKGYSNSVPATREFRPGYFLCDECMQREMQEILNSVGSINPIEGVEEISAKLDNSSNPIYTQVCEILNLPNELRYNDEDLILRKREQIFNYHANAIVNLSQEEVLNFLEQARLVLFQIKIATEPYQDYINTVKAKAREDKNLGNLGKSLNEVGKVVKPKSKTALNADEKMAKLLGVPLSVYLQNVAKAKEKEFVKITGMRPEDVEKAKEMDRKPVKLDGSIFKKKLNPITGKEE